MADRASLTAHAAARSRERGIPPLVIDWLQAYGAEQFDGQGARVRYFDRRSKRQLERDVGSAVVHKLNHWLNCYLVESNDGAVVTVGHRQRPIRR
ncbi:MAG: hypothetical protein AB7P31_00850 [Steroidobacteraceae bacterium]